MNSTRKSFIRLGITLVSIAVIVGFMRSIVRQINRTDVVGEHRETLLKEEARNRELKERLKEATSPAFIEKQAREKLGLAREGDTIVLLETPKTSTAHIQAEKVDTMTNWKRWWRLFF